ncbi:multifunctional nuclease/2',3'-cyclic-nucleotide 2'-phosphodiesterase/5'-nucleotidase/3'-nucleotidase, partial [Schumannella luteola]
ADAVAVSSELGAVSLGSITEDIRRAVQSNGSENRGGESTLGNLIADAQLAATQDLSTEVAIMNPGGIRADLVYAGTGANDPDGNVTYAEAALIQPFANTLVTLDLTGAQLKTVLEQQWQPAGAARPYLKLGLSQGLEYVYDPSAPTGSHITAITLNGEPVTDDEVIKVVTNSFLAAGGDNFGGLTAGANKSDSGRIDLDAFVDYIGDHSPVAPDTAQRAVGATLSAPADGTAYQGGEQ